MNSLYIDPREYSSNVCEYKKEKDTPSKTWKNSKSLWQKINKVGYIHTIRHNAAVKRNELQ